jgi:hypothetical protein
VIAASTLLGSVDKAHSGVAAGVLNSTRQTGSVLGVAVFGSLIGQTDAFLFGARIALIISAALCATPRAERRHVKSGRTKRRRHHW